MENYLRVNKPLGLETESRREALRFLEQQATLRSGGPSLKFNAAIVEVFRCLKSSTVKRVSGMDFKVSQIVNPENLAELLRGGTVSSELGAVSFKFGDLPLSLNTAWNVWLSSEYGLGRFSIGLRPGAAATNQFRLRMQLLQWHWKVTGIDLPETLRDQIARELAN
jgi:hypothetical protein